MRIDIHTHCARQTGLTRANGTRYPTPTELVEKLDSEGIDQAVVLSTVSPEMRYVLVPPEAVIDMCADYPDRLIPFCNTDPRFLTNDTSAEFRPVFEYYRSVGFKGVGEYIPNIPLDHDMNRRVFAAVEAVGLPLTFHLAPALGGYYGCYDELGLPRLERILDSFPDLVFLAHSQVFWSEIGSDVTEESRGGYPKGPVEPGRVVELMRRHGNLWGDLSAGSGYNAISRDRSFGAAFLEEFNDRLLFGTDIANVPQETPIVRYLDDLRASRAISDETYERVTWKNARRVLALE
jgi:uncharacterized protein